MIEIEKKVIFTSEHISEIQANGTFLHTKQFTDIYFDTEAFDYTLRNMWLRKREDDFELKVGVKKEGDVIDRYDEITDLCAICEKLEIAQTTNLEHAFPQYGLAPFCTFKTTRTKYQYGPYTIDIDHAEFGSLTYDVAEIELLVTSTKEISQAERAIEDLVSKFKINPTQRILGKLPYFLSKKSQKHYNALLEAKIIKVDECCDLLKKN